MTYALLPASMGSAHNWSVSRGTGFPFMPHKQVLKDGVDALVFLVVQFRIFVKGHVFGSANSLHFAQHLDSFAFQSVEFCAHTFRPGGWQFYGPGFSSTRVF
jgi:hypothetical protein